MTNSKEFSSQRFRWLDQVLADIELPASAFKVAYRIGKMFNEKFDGKAWESHEKISEAVGLSKGTVFTAVRQLHERGHLRIEWGRRGRGHPHNYWLILKHQETKVEEIKVQRTELSDGNDPEIKVQFSAGKVQPTEQTLLINSTTDCDLRSQSREREVIVATAASPDGSAAAPTPPEKKNKNITIDPDAEAKGPEPPVDALSMLRSVWRRGHTTDNTSKRFKGDRKALNVACAGGADIDEILDGAKKWVAAYAAVGGRGVDMLPTLQDWLEAEDWKKPPPKRKRFAKGNGSRRQRESKGDNLKAYTQRATEQRLREEEEKRRANGGADR